MANGETPASTDALESSPPVTSNFTRIDTYFPEHSDQRLLCCFHVSIGSVMVHENGVGPILTVYKGEDCATFALDAVPEGYSEIVEELKSRMW